MKAKVSFDGLVPSTGVPRIKKSRSSIGEDKVLAKLKIGAFVESAIDWAKRLVFPVLEK